ncbi:uncharacterized protein N7483_011831 [Penicillium malachiteum]|uniref:uncharacterized protein n=1 Tax=Penicillium malachiteum TaxID=1324776 RepID=UPI0025499FEE|nr:uncharacterized protein N7483_011831 [Penicillium malachiteum]KAJ5714650.1 hypothetical protein N7483_011831 [Penicillium malachiteum]
MAAILKTSHLGEIQGKAEDGVTNYLGIQYATLKNRFADPELVETRSGDILDATNNGPTPFLPSGGYTHELDHVQHTLPKKELSQSDVDGLNLNIAVPSDATPDSKLPVLFFIHGGGLSTGSSAWPQYDLTRIVQLSIEKNVPMVIVTIDYRLGAAGFLTSEELREAGYKANNGLRDQRVALEWVQKHIQDFGGDPENVTAAGQSAGGASVTHHLHSTKPLFKRAIAMGGSSLPVIALPYVAHEANYDRAISALGLTDATPEERIKALLEIPGEELVLKLAPSTRTAAAIDGDFIRPGVTFNEISKPGSELLPGKTWCQDLLIGCNELDSSILAFLMPQIKVNTTKKFIAAIHKVLALYPEEAKRIRETYEINDDTPNEQAYPSVLTFMNDILYTASTLAFASGWKETGNAYVYYFNEGNPWEGPWKGHANHVLDVAFLFQNFREFLSPEQQAVGIAFAEDIFKFCYGQASWPATASGDIENGFSARIYGPSQEGITATVSSQAFGGETRRQSILFDCASQVHLDEFMKVVGEFISN